MFKISSWQLQTYQHFSKCIAIIWKTFIGTDVFIFWSVTLGVSKWNLSKNSFGVLLTDLSKAFDCLSRELLIAKLAAYGFSRSALKSMYTYLSDRKQKK